MYFWMNAWTKFWDWSLLNQKFWSLSMRRFHLLPWSFQTPSLSWSDILIKKPMENTLHHKLTHICFLLAQMNIFRNTMYLNNIKYYWISIITRWVWSTNWTSWTCLRAFRSMLPLYPSHGFLRITIIKIILHQNCHLAMITLRY